MRIASVDLNSANYRNFGNSYSYATSPVNAVNNVSFGNSAPRNKDQVIFISAESDPWSKNGGVGTVCKDYRTSFPGKKEDRLEITPYYNGDVNEEKKTVGPAHDKDGNLIFRSTKGDVKVRLVGETTIQWGLEEEAPVKVYALIDDKDKLSYFVYTDDTASMKKPYDNCPIYKSNAKIDTRGWDGDVYAKYSAAAIEALPMIIKDKGENFNPATIVCSDAQTAYSHEYLAQKVSAGDKDYEGIKSTHFLHNMSAGYLGETSKQNMFVNLGATPSMIRKVMADPMYKDLGEEYFTPFVEDTLDENGTANPTMIVAHYADKGNIPAADTVSESYAEAVAMNPQAAGPIQKSFKRLFEKEVFQGILNPFEDKNVDAAKPLPNELYNKDCTDKDGTIYPAFELYPEDPSYEDAKRIKNSNKAKFLERLSAQDPTIITGNPKRTAKINPEVKQDGSVIRPDLIQKVKDGNGDEVPLFITWGRCDTQKGLDVVIDAFSNFAKTDEGKNAILIVGAGLDANPESKKVSNKMTEALLDPELKGRVVHIDGWAPAYAMASAADAAIFSSRFEPCGLTDLEAQKYYCSPIVANTQGLKQKNFDPRNEDERHKAASYKTQHEFHLLKSQVQPIIDGYVKGDEAAKEAVKKEFPIFYTKDSNGVETYDDSLFVEFAQDYTKFLNDKKSELKWSAGKEGELPEGWDDWDTLSAEWEFKFDGCARKLKDGILSAEFSDALGAFVGADSDTKRLLFENAKKLDTSWAGNGELHPSGKSTYQLYKERHLESDSVPPTADDLTATDEEEFDETQVERQSEDIKNRIATYAAGALTGVAAALAKRTGKPQVVDDSVLKSQIAELQQKLTDVAKKNKQNMIITGVVAAVAAGLTAFLAARAHYKPRVENQDLNADLYTPQMKVESSPAEVKSPVAPVAPQLSGSVSMADFQNKLNNIA